MNRKIAFWIIFIGLCGFGYCVLSFMELDFNFRVWKVWARGVMSIWFLVSLFWAFLSVQE